MTLVPVFSLHGVLSLKTSHEAMAALDAPQADQLEQTFARGARHGLLHLGASELGTALPTVLAWWRELGARHVTALCALPGLSDVRGKPGVPPPEDELERLAAGVPPMIGAKYLTAQVLASPRRETDRAFDAELVEAGGTVQARAQHLPLGEYAGAKNRNRLLSLPTPVQRASEGVAWLKDMVASGAIYHPLRWSPQQALQFLRIVPALEAAGVIVRMPASWHMGRPARPKVTATVGGKAPGELGLDALLDFRVEMTLDG